MYARISEDRKGAGLGVERQLEDQCVAHRGHRLGVLVMTTPPDATHTSPRWSVRTAGYRNPHRGALDQGGQSSGAARVGFTPQPDPFEPGPLWLGSSADPPRCGPTCLTTAT